MSNLLGKKILVTSTDVMMIQFLLPHVKYLSSCGAVVDVACSSAEGYQKEGYAEKIQNELPKESKYYFISTERTPYSLKNIKGYNELKNIVNSSNYDLVWTNEPVMSVMTRLAARKYRKKGKVLYMAHGYHFFKGAPKKNWIYYPIEKIMSRLCDMIVVINLEDYEFTKKHFRVPVRHINGIGLQLEKFTNFDCDFEKKRKELNINSNDILIVSVGELQARKNHQVVIKAIAEVNNENIKYIICGRGELQEYLQEMSEKLGISKQIQFLGHRYDIPEILSVANIFAHPSQREGLGISALEAMATGLPVLASNVQGIKDYVLDGENGFTYSPYDVDGFQSGIEQLINDKELCDRMGKNNQECVKKYTVENSVEAVKKIISELIEDEK